MKRHGGLALLPVSVLDQSMQGSLNAIAELKKAAPDLHSISQGSGLS